MHVHPASCGIVFSKLVDERPRGHQVRNIRSFVWYCPYRTRRLQEKKFAKSTLAPMRPKSCHYLLTGYRRRPFDAANSPTPTAKTSMPSALASSAAAVVAVKLPLWPSVMTIMNDAVASVAMSSAVPSLMPMYVFVPPPLRTSASEKALKSWAESNVPDEINEDEYCTYDAIPPLSKRFRAANAATVSTANCCSLKNSVGETLRDPSRTSARLTCQDRGASTETFLVN